MTEKPKFNIGDAVFFVESSCGYGLKVPCRMCFGKRKVTVILGNDEQVLSKCEYCAAGVDPPSGYSTTWEAASIIHSGTITGVRLEHDGWRYDVGGRGVSEPEIFYSRDEAVPLMEARLKEESERKLTYERDHFVTATKKQIWSVGYHRGRIADHERQIRWHEMRLCMIKEKS